MLEKEAFALLAKRVWHMLSGNTVFGIDVTNAINRLHPKLFRENVARVVLGIMTDSLQRTVLPAEGETGEDFIDAVAFAFTSLAEGDRPPKFTGYTPHAFAEMLILQFCTAYTVLDERAPTDGMLLDCKGTLEFPTCSAEALTLRERLRAMPATAFGQYTLSN